MPDCLIVDDEPDICELISLTLNKMGISSKSALSLLDARKQLERHTFKLCLTDMKLPDGNGIDLVRFVSDEFPQMPIAVITAHGNMESAIEAMKAGAFDFVQKPVDLKILRSIVETTLRLSKEGAITSSNKVGSPQTSDDIQLIGRSNVMNQIRKNIHKLAKTQAPVHISGESGTGKEVAAKMIHYSSPRGHQPFIPVNCGAIPQELMESEFFGHIKGSFTGAIADKKGLFQEADKGTLFLDEIADLPVAMQVKLLRAIQEKRIRPVGSSKEIPIDVRIISASHKDIGKMVHEGTFRQDLYFRINVIELDLPPLRTHKDDLPDLIDHFLNKIARQNAAEKAILDEGAEEVLASHDYPGNVRELENLLEGAFALHEGEIITQQDLKLTRKQSQKSSLSSSYDSAESLPDEIKELENNMILNALDECQWNRTAAAKKLGLTLRQLRYRLEKIENVKK